MVKVSEERIGFDKKSAIRLIVLAALIIFAISIWQWWRIVYMNSDRVFWGMIDNNLATTSITRHVTQQNQNQSLDQYIQANFGANNSTHGLITLKQASAQNTAEVKSETIGTPTIDYNRYLSIKTTQRNSKNQPISTKAIEGVWAKNEQPGSNGQYFSQSILTIVPFANFNLQNRQALEKFMKDHKVYTLLPNPKSEKSSGHSVYVYQVDVDPAAYIATMVGYGKRLGMGDLGLDPSQYAGSPPLRVEFTVDKLSRQLIKIKYSSNGQEETYSSQGLEAPLQIPQKTIPLNELQNRIQASLQ